MAVDDGATPLLIATHRGHAEIVQILKDAGAV
jgi:ankyrin repeat protein